MKVTVTHLKAPWPADAVIGSVVDVQAEQLPSCFVGKCTPAEDDAEAGFAWTPVVHVEPEAAEPANLPASQEDLQVARSLQAAAEAEAAELRATVERLNGELAASAEALKAAQAAAKAEAAELRATVERLNGELAASAEALKAAQAAAKAAAAGKAKKG